MSRAAVITVALTVALLAGCARPTAEPQPDHAAPAPPSPIQQVTVGASAERVLDILGEPAAVESEETDEETETWYYDDGVVILRRGSVIFRGPVLDRSRP